MGTNRTVPETTKALINTRPDTKMLYDRYHKLQDDIEAIEPQSKFQLRRQLEQHVDLMRTDEVLVRFLDLREGLPLTISEIYQMASEACDSLVLVD